MADHIQSANEELANSITHAFGILFCAIGTPFMIGYARADGSAVTLWSVSIFCFGMAMVYLSSTIFHALYHTKYRRVLEVLDHISIFLLIAGTYTPIVIKYTDKTTAFIFLGIMWSIVAVGSFLKIFFMGKYQMLSLAMYLVLGWMAVFIIKPIMAHMPTQILWCVVGGGLAYTFGVIFFVWRRLTYSHAIWHLFVLTGTVIHFIAVYESIGVRVRF